jgi:hypothetical protein
VTASDLRLAQNRVSFLCLGEHERPRVAIIPAGLAVASIRFAIRRLRVAHQSIGPSEASRTRPTRPSHLNDARSALIVRLDRSCSLHPAKSHEASRCLPDLKRRITNHANLTCFGGN